MPFYNGVVSHKVTPVDGVVRRDFAVGQGADWTLRLPEGNGVRPRFRASYAEKQIRRGRSEGVVSFVGPSVGVDRRARRIDSVRRVAHSRLFANRRGESQLVSSRDRRRPGESSVCNGIHAGVAERRNRHRGSRSRRRTNSRDVKCRRLADVCDADEILALGEHRNLRADNAFGNGEPGAQTPRPDKRGHSDIVRIRGGELVGLREPDDILPVVHDSRNGSVCIVDRERELVVRLVAGGKRNRVAHSASIHEHTYGVRLRVVCKTVKSVQRIISAYLRLARLFIDIVAPRLGNGSRPKSNSDRVRDVPAVARIADRAGDCKRRGTHIAAGAVERQIQACLFLGKRVNAVRTHRRLRPFPTAASRPAGIWQIYGEAHLRAVHCT